MMTQGEIWFVDFVGSVGHEYQKCRPAVIIQSNEQLNVASIITIMPFTSRKNKHKDDILVFKDVENKLSYDSILKVHQIHTFDKMRFIKKIGVLNTSIIEQIKEYLRKHFGI